MKSRFVLGVFILSLFSCSKGLIGEIIYIHKQNNYFEVKLKVCNEGRELIRIPSIKHRLHSDTLSEKYYSIVNDTLILQISQNEIDSSSILDYDVPNGLIYGITYKNNRLKKNDCFCEGFIFKSNIEFINKVKLPYDKGFLIIEQLENGNDK